MAFKHKALALDGVGFGHKVLATLGTLWFDVEIIVTPPSGGGGYVTGYGAPVYTVKFVVTLKNGKVIASEHKYTQLGLKTLEKVISTFKGGSKIVNYISVQASLINKKIQQIIVRIKK